MTEPMPDPYAGLILPCHRLCRTVYPKGNPCACATRGPEFYCQSLMTALLNILEPTGSTVFELTALFNGAATIKMNRGKK